MNIAVNIVNIEKARQPLPSSPTKRGGRNHPQPLPRREGSAMRWNCCRECCLVLSGMLLGTVGNAAFYLSQRVGLFVPMGGTITKYIVLCFLQYCFIPHSAAFTDGCSPSLRGRGWWWGFSMFTMFTAMFTPQLSDTQRVVTK